MRRCFFVLLAGWFLVGSFAGFSQRAPVPDVAYGPSFPTPEYLPEFRLSGFRETYPLLNLDDLRGTFPAKERHRLMRSLNDAALTRRVKSAQRQKVLGLLFTATAVVISFIPKVETTTTNNGFMTTTTTTTRIGMFARPVSFLFYIPGVTLQITGRNTEHRAAERYNDLVQEQLYRH